jgi:hypothetical protein
MSPRGDRRGTLGACPGNRQGHGHFPGRLLAALAALAALLAVAAAEPGRRGDGGGEPLVNEDIVRQVMIGAPEASILALIAGRPVDFDLSPEVVVELRQAGVGERILEAMRRRQAAMPRSEPPPVAAPAPEAVGTLEIDFAPDAEADKPSEASIIAIRRLPAKLQRRGGLEVAETTDMALAVLCVTGDHVPDHWASRTPITQGPRHQLLLFRPGSATDTMKGFEVIYLTHEDTYRVDLPAGGHDIVVAAAGRQAGSGDWRIVESDEARVAVLPGRTTRLTVRAHSRLRGSYMAGFAVDGEWKVSAEPPGPAAEGERPASAAGGERP